MALNLRGSGDRVMLVATATRTSGAPTVESLFAGVPQTTAASGELFSMALTGEYEFTDPGGSSLGAVVYITDATGALTFAAGAGKRVFGRVSRLPASGGPGAVPASKMWVVINGFITVTG